MKKDDIDRTPVAKDIITDCKRCDLELNHIVVRHNKEGIVDRVKCHTCGFEHKYKPIKKKAAPKAKRKASTRKKTPEKEYIAWMEKNSDYTPVAYNMKASFNEGDVIDHKTFGQGIIKGVSFERIEVLFHDSIKTLAANKL